MKERTKFVILVQILRIIGICTVTFLASKAGYGVLGQLCFGLLNLATLDLAYNIERKL